MFQKYDFPTFSKTDGGKGPRIHWDEDEDIL